MPQATSVHPVPTVTATATVVRGTMDLHEALKSTLRAWLISRDAAVWCLVSGVEDGDCLERIDLKQAQSAVDRMNVLRDVAVQFSEQLASKREPADVIMRRVIDELLASESPMFLLRVEHTPSAF